MSNKEEFDTDLSLSLSNYSGHLYDSLNMQNNLKDNNEEQLECDSSMNQMSDLSEAIKCPKCGNMFLDCSFAPKHDMAQSMGKSNYSDSTMTESKSTMTSHWAEHDGDEEGPAQLDEPPKAYFHTTTNNGFVQSSDEQSELFKSTLSDTLDSHPLKSSYDSVSKGKSISPDSPAEGNVELENDIENVEKEMKANTEEEEENQDEVGALENIEDESEDDSSEEDTDESVDVVNDKDEDFVVATDGIPPVQKQSYRVFWVTLFLLMALSGLSMYVYYEQPFPEHWKKKFEDFQKNQQFI